MKISIDSGKSQTKVSFNHNGEVNNFMFLSNVALEANEIPTTEEATTVIIDAGNGEKTYLVGEYGLNTYLENRQEISKENQVHKILVLTAIAKVLDKCNRHDCMEVDIAINMPLSSYLTEGSQQSVKDFYKNKGKYYSVKMNNKQYNFVIKDVTPYFECLGAVLLERNKFANMEVVALNMGSLNNCFATFNKNKPVGRLSGFDNDGVEGMLIKAEEILIKHGIYNLTTENIEDVIKGLYPIKDEAAADIRNLCAAHVKTLKHKLSNKNIKVNSKIRACGGGAILLERYLKDGFADLEVCTNSLYVDADAGLRLIK